MTTGDDLAGKLAYTGLTYDDVLLLPAESDVIPSEADTSTWLTRRIQLNIPLLSSAMDTVTEARMAIAMARQGGVGVLHYNLSPEDQAAQVDLVKRSESGMVSQPVTCAPEATIAEADELMGRYRISGVPVTDPEGVLVGIVTNRDIRFERDHSRLVSEVMTRMPLVTGPVGISGDDAMGLLARHKIEKLPLVDGTGHLKGLITVKDFTKREQYPDATKDDRGRLIAAGAVGVGEDGFKRALQLVEAGADILVVDTAHGHSRAVLAAVSRLKTELGERIDVIGGNVATYEGGLALVEAGADAVKTGVGPGCFAAGTRVLMANGTYQDIEKIVAGDRVIAGTGLPTTVVKAWCTGIREVVALRHTASGVETYATADHRYLTGDLSPVSPATVSSRGHAKVLEQPTPLGGDRIAWKEIGSVDRAVLLFPNLIEFELPDHLRIDLRDVAVRESRLERYNTVIEESEDLGYLLGFFLGDGHAFLNRDGHSDIGLVSFHVGSHETDVRDRLLDVVERVVGVRPTIGTEGGVQHLHLYSLRWARLLSACGKKDDKHLPEELLCSDRGYLGGLLAGLIDSDGHVDQGGRRCFGNTSRALSELYGLLCFMVEGSLPNVDEQMDLLSVIKLLGVRETGLSVPVYDLEVEDETHSFIADNAIVHNSICTTRVVAGVGVPQVSAIAEVARACKPAGVPVIADGGLQYSGDIAKALAVGADSVMVGSLLAGCEESPGELIFMNGKQFKSYRGMGSLGAMQSRGGTRGFSRGRYAQSDVLSDDQLVPQGIEGQVPYRGPLSGVAHQLVGGLRASMGYVGAPTVAHLQEHARLIRITPAGLKESHPHDIQMTVEAPNYHSR